MLSIPPKTIFVTLALILFALGVLGSIVYYFGLHSQSNEQDLSNQLIVASSTPTPVSSNSILPATEPVLIYAEQIGNELADNHYWPTMRIFRKIGSSSPEILATVGGVGKSHNFSQGSSFSISPNRKYLSIGLVDELRILDLDTKELRAIFNSVGTVLGSGAFSPDDSTIAVVSLTDTGSVLHSIDIASGADTILRKEKGVRYENAVRWRSDGKIIVSITAQKGCAAPHFSYYDPSDGELHDMMSSSGVLSESGLQMAIKRPSDSAPSCPGMCDDSTDFYEIMNPISQTVSGTVGQKGAFVRFISFAPDGSQVLFESKRSSVSACEYDSPSGTHFTQSTFGGLSTVVNGRETLRQWHANTLDAKWLYNSNTGEPVAVSVDGVVMASSTDSTHPLSIIAEYWK